MRLTILLCIFLHLVVGVIQAAPTTNTTNTTTNDSLEAPSFTTRTLWTIVSSSVLTLFACIYSAIHPNIPNPKDSPYHVLRRRLGIMIMALIAPELIVTWALRQWFSVREVTRQFNLKDSGYPNVHLEQPETEEKELVQAEAPKRHENRFLRWVKRSVKAYFSEQSQDYKWTRSHSSFALMGGFMLYDKDGEPYLTLRPDIILHLIDEKCIDVPALTEKQIHDKSKGNAISKGLIMLQVAWFVMQLITRAIYRLDITQLEAGTLAFAVLNFLTYAVWWNKPLSVQCPHPVYWTSDKPIPKANQIDIPESDPFAKFGILAGVIRSIAELLGSPTIPTSRKLQVPTFDGSVKLKDSNKMFLQVAGSFMATIFGCIHCMAWFFAFPTYQEQVLWRMSAIAITFTPWLLLLILLMPCARWKSVVRFVCAPIVFASFMLYILARAVFLVLMFTTLRNLPPDAYRAVSWTSSVPHL